MYKQREKNESLLAASALPVTEDAREGLKFGPAEPTKTKSAIICGSQANLQLVSYSDEDMQGPRTVRKRGKL